MPLPPLHAWSQQLGKRQRGACAQKGLLEQPNNCLSVKGLLAGQDAFSEDTGFCVFNIVFEGRE